MSRSVHPFSAHPERRFPRMRFVLAGSTILLLFFPIKTPAAIALQTDAPVAGAPQQNTAPVPDDIYGPLRSALAQSGAALNQVQIDHWKVSREWKGQLQSDANSIQQDLTTQLPMLFQACRQSPGMLQPRLNLMHNIDALYDVLVRVTTAAGIAGGKTDTAILDNALQNLESARKTASAQLLQAASQQDRRLVELQARTQNVQGNESPAKDRSKTIVVDNRVTHPTHHRPRKPIAKEKPAPAPGSGNSTPNPESHTTIP